MLRHSIICGLVTSAMLSACAPNATNQGSNRIDANQIKSNASLTAQQKSEQLASAAERLTTPSSFMHAHDVAEEALQRDPKNSKARFLKAILAPTMELKGILTRIEPLVKQRPHLHSRFAKWSNDVRAMNPEKSVSSFLFEGQADITTERELQDVIARYTLRLDELRKTLNEIKGDGEISIYINDESFKQQSITEAVRSCWIRRQSPGVFDASECDFSDAYERKLNRADMEALQQIVAGYQTYFTLANAYDLSGVYKLSGKFTGNAEKDARSLLANPQFGKLRDEGALSLIPDVLRDAVIGAHYALAQQSDLCPKGEASTENRPGYLFSEGLCAKSTDSVEKALALIEMALKNNTVPVEFNHEGQSVRTVVDVMKVFSSPLRDIRELQPTLDTCGGVSQVQDPTFGGVLPKGEINTILAQASARSCTSR